MTVSETDIEHLKIIRASVRDHTHAASKLFRKGMRVLDVAPQEHAGAKAFFSHVETLDIQDGADYKADICQTNYDIIADESFDIIICTEVLEHVTNPFDAVKELKRILKKGGHLFVTTPFNFRIHGPLPDNWRFTVHGLNELFKDFKVSIEEVSCERFLMPIHYRLIANK